MSIICPTVLAEDPHAFRNQLERVEPFAGRIQIDLADGNFATKTIELDQVHWPDGLVIDLHLMYADPTANINKLLEMKPHLVIIHKEAKSDLLGIVEALRGGGIDFGVALLPETNVEMAREEIYVANHVLIFGGKLGSFGGDANLDLLQKVGEIREINPSIEIGWDGGVNAENVKIISEAGIDVVNVGGFIQRAEKPQEAYDILNSIVQGGHDG